MRHYITFLTLFVFLNTIQISISWAQQAAIVQVDAVQNQSFGEMINFSARLMPKQSGVVAARTSGPVTKINIELGDRVKKGSLIATVDASILMDEQDRLNALVNEAKQEIARTKAEAQLQRQQVQRLEGLKNSVAFSRGRYDDALQLLIINEISIEMAKARLARAKANLALNKTQTLWANVIAPYQGIITDIHTEAGSWLTSGQPVVSMINDSDFEVVADIPTQQIQGLSEGMLLPLSLDDGTNHQIIIRSLIPEENALSRTRQVRFTPNFGKMKKPHALGQSATIELPIGPKKNVVTVHKDAIVNMAGRTFVYVAVSGFAQIRPISIGAALGSRFEVLGGLRADDLVVVRGNERLQPGQAIKINEKP